MVSRSPASAPRGVFRATKSDRRADLCPRYLSRAPLYASRDVRTVGTHQDAEGSGVEAVHQPDSCDVRSFAFCMPSTTAHEAPELLTDPLMRRASARKPGTPLESSSAATLADRRAPPPRRYRIDAAVDYFYSDALAMQNAERAAVSASKNDKTGPKLEAQFNSYKGWSPAVLRLSDLVVLNGLAMTSQNPTALHRQT